MTGHFDEIAARYDQEIPEHVRLHLLEKKTGKMIDALRRWLPSARAGVDLGCGTGHHLRAMAEAGYAMTGLDVSRGMAERAQQTTRDLGIAVELGSITAAPFPDGSFDFAFAINVLHHLASRREQGEALKEAARLLRPGGLFLLQDFNGNSPLVRFYLERVFPFTSRIDDDGKMVWVSPRWLGREPDSPLSLCEVSRFTFIPNVMPRWPFRVARRVEWGLEALTGGRAGAHFLAVMRKEHSAGSGHGSSGGLTPPDHGGLAG